MPNLPSGRANWGEAPPRDLVAAINAATHLILSNFLARQDGAASRFCGFFERIRPPGPFASFSTDRGSLYFFPPKAGEEAGKERLTQAGRALRQLRIEHIPSSSAQGRGRMERL